MMLLHEFLPDEAAVVKSAIESTLRLPVRPVECDLSEYFVPIPGREAFESRPNLQTLLARFDGVAVQLLTRRDIHDPELGPDVAWLFGASLGPWSIVSVSRLFEPGAIASGRRNIELVHKRLQVLALHEIGHDLVKGAHLVDATWVDARTCERASLGRHCADARCVMYAVIDLKAPSTQIEYLLVGDRIASDAGLDDLVQRLHEAWYCERCIQSMSVSPDYAKVVMQAR